MADDLRHAVGGNLRAIRKAQGLTQERFGERYGLKRSWIGRVENGRRNLTMDTIQRLAESLEVSVFVLVQRPPEVGPPPPLAESPGEEEARGEQPG